MSGARPGTGQEFSPEDNQYWLDVTRPMLEAFFQARYFLKMGRGRLKSAAGEREPGWAGEEQS